MELSNEELIAGIFIEESKNRFICRVLVNDIILECYVPSSARLENFIKLKNKRVLLMTNKGKDKRTKYTLFAVYHRKRLIMLNLNIVNRLFESIIKSGQYAEYYGYNTVKRESEHKGYKADILLEGTEKLIIENKALISVNKAVTFPTVYSERAVAQLKKLDGLLCEGCKVYYNFIALSPFISSVQTSTEEVEYNKAFAQCVSHGMQVNGYRLYYEDNSLKSKRIQVII
jgi:sugar fermentation stimulation protein A